MIAMMQLIKTRRVWRERYIQAIERNESDVLGGDGVANLLVHGRSSVDLREPVGHQILESCGGERGVPNVP